MFDLPSVTAQERREYTKFRKYLLKSGFLMIQESIYCKLVPNASSADWVIHQVKNNKPPAGLVQVLKITEKQFSKMEFIVGEHTSDVLDSDERIVII